MLITVPEEDTNLTQQVIKADAITTTTDVAGLIQYPPFY